MATLVLHDFSVAEAFILQLGFNISAPPRYLERRGRQWFYRSGLAVLNGAPYHWTCHLHDSNLAVQYHRLSRMESSPPHSEIQFSLRGESIMSAA